MLTGPRASAEFWATYARGLFGVREPWLGHFIFLEEDKTAFHRYRPEVGAIPISTTFFRASFLQRYVIFSQRLALNREYSAVALILAPQSRSGAFAEPAGNIRFCNFIKSLYASIGDGPD
ncbi:MAG: hypothetical protein H7343_24240 [Undibacterium sp.]|nr:hypothetical protein [Opitutaceae bacterium]